MTIFRNFSSFEIFCLTQLICIILKEDNLYSYLNLNFLNLRFIILSQTTHFILHKILIICSVAISVRGTEEVRLCLLITLLINRVSSTRPQQMLQALILACDQTCPAKALKLGEK